MTISGKKFIFILLVLLFAICSSAVAINFWPFRQLADEATAQKLNLDIEEATIRAVNKAMPAVVSVMVYSKEKYNVLDLTTGKSVIKDEKVLKGSGTGFLISDNGWVLTNKHVVETAVNPKNAEFIVVLNNNKKYSAFLIAKDPFNDLAILRVLGKDFPYLELTDTSNLPIGSTVLAIGNAMGRYQNSVTKGIVSGIGRSIVASDKNGKPVDLDNVIQTDAEINQGNSGGPLINLDGRVIGVNVAVDATGSAIGFALPANDVKPVVESVKKYGKIIRPYLGIRYIMITPELAIERGLPRDNGALIYQNQLGEPAVVVNSPADRAGLKVNDIIFEINGKPIGEKNTLLSVTQTYKPGDKLTLKLQRGQEILTKEVVLEEYK